MLLDLGKLPLLQAVWESLQRPLVFLRYPQMVLVFLLLWKNGLES